MGRGAETIDELIARMDALLAPMETAHDPRRFFLATYRRTTMAVHEALVAGSFVDARWVERWDLAFAGFYLDALDDVNRGVQPPGPWAAAFMPTGDTYLPPLRHVLLGMNAHINYDLPQALLATITDDEFDDPELVSRREVDHQRIDAILASRVDAEDQELQRVERPGDRTRLDRLMKPFNQAGTKRFMREARRKVWRNAMLLSAARRQDPATLAAQLAVLEQLARRRVEDLRAPGQVIVRLAVGGFGVELPRGA